MSYGHWFVTSVLPSSPSSLWPMISFSDKHLTVRNKCAFVHVLTPLFKMVLKDEDGTLVLDTSS